ncbi:MAG TPA: TetR/AcrR family transcriptional regulator [Steroidobacteraceae bacterium]|nr:TetR/AcrR family transcriptional regulator [Steroidobacteraceae bacterium]
MPKIVDHERRREEIAALTLGVMRSGGMENATVRAIARRGRISIGVLSHYFKSKDELVGFTFRWLAERTFAELDTLVRAAPAGLGALQAALEYMLPRSGKTTDFALWMTLWGRAASNPRLAREHRSYYARWRRCIRSLLAEARSRGEMSARLSTDDATDLLVATVDGLWIDCVMEPRRFRTARRRKLLRQLLGAVTQVRRRPAQAVAP